MSDTPSPVLEKAADRSLTSLNWLNLFVAQMQTGFGAFLSVYLTTHRWTNTDIGFVLTMGTVASMAAQLPAGALVDLMSSKRNTAGAAILAIVCAALLVGARPTLLPVLFAEVLQGAASCVLTLSIAGITLSLARLDKLGERLGGNVRFSAIGAFSAAAVMGAIGDYVSHRDIYWLSAICGLAALVSLRSIQPVALATADTRTDHLAAMPRTARKGKEEPKSQILREPFLWIFAGCMALFQLGNAAMLPIAASGITRADAPGTGLVVPALIIVPQALAAWLSPYMGRAAQRWGRRPVLVLGLAAMPLRAMLFATGAHPYLMVAFQALDGISAAVLGMIVPLIVADLTRRRGRFNLAMSVVGLAVGIGASVSPPLAGPVPAHFGETATFFGLALAGIAAVALAWLRLPETGPRRLTLPAQPLRAGLERLRSAGRRIRQRKRAD